MKSFRTAFLSAALIVSVASLASAGPVIDQDQANDQVLMAGFWQSDLAQSFQQAHDNVSGAGILLADGFGTSGTVTISLWDNLPNQAGTVLATGSALGTEGNWVDVFWNPVAVTPDTTLYLVFTSDSSALGIAGDVFNPYSRGMVFANTGYGPFPVYDYSFRTYYDDSPTPVVPAPAALLLGVIGTGVAGYLRRRRAL